MSKSSRLEVGHALVRARALVLSLVMLGLGLALLVLSGQLFGNNEYAELLDFLTSKGMPSSEAVQRLDAVAGVSGMSEILSSLGGTLLAIGAVSIAWDLWVNRNWMKAIRDSVLSIVSGEIDIKPNDARRTMLRRILEKVHGEHLGAALFAQSEAASPAHIRSDFMYNIKFNERRGNFISADFRIIFRVPEMPDTPRITFARVANSLEFHNRFQDLVEREPSTLYRYVLVTGEELENLGMDPFEVTEFKVRRLKDGSFVGPSFDLLPNSKDSADGGCDVVFDVPEASRKGWRKNRIGACEVDISIRTVIDGTRNDFPICFGYPVNGFKSTLDATAIGAASVDILEFFTSTERFRREDMRREQKGLPDSVLASGSIDGLILPESGLTYVWQQSTAPMYNNS